MIAVISGLGWIVALDALLLADPELHRELALRHARLSDGPPAVARLEALRARRAIEEVVVIGARGPLQATFTTLELRELGDLEAMADVDVIVDPADFADLSDEDLEAAGKTVKQNVKVLRAYAAQRSAEPAAHRVSIPHLADRDQGHDRVTSIVLGRNELVDDGGRLVAKDTGERERNSPRSGPRGRLPRHADSRTAVRR